MTQPRCASGTTCSEAARACSAAGCVDGDRDGQRVLSATACMGDPAALDCDDGDQFRFSGAGRERCDPLRHDEDCSYLTVGSDTDQDGDRDGAPNNACCNIITEPMAPAELTEAALLSHHLQLINPRLVCGLDCDDSNPRVHPGAAEVCNGIDDDCDGMVDEGLRARVYRDCDGHGDGDEGDQGTLGCNSPPPVACGFPMVLTHTDCDDRDPRRRRMGAVEVCDGLDNNCNGAIDTDGAGLECALGQPGAPAATRACMDSMCGASGGAQSCDNTCHWSECVRTGGRSCRAGALTAVACGNDETGHNANCGRRRCSTLCEPGACEFDAEGCNQRDDDCNGRIDEGLGHRCERTWSYTAGGLATDWGLLGSATRDTATGRLVLSNGVRSRVGAAYLNQPVQRALTMEVEAEVPMLQGETDGLGNGFAVYLLDTRVAPPTDGTGVVPTGARGYVFSLIYQPSGPILFIERLTDQRTLIARQDLPMISPVTGDTCAGAGNFIQIGGGGTSRVHRGGGANTALITLRGRVLSFSLTYGGRSGGCAVAAGNEPDDLLFGRPLYLGFGVATTDRTM
ncbi:MAG: hypothetical protein IPF99_34585, partial [Deltaproteobacteria bacterium]|nr:hypothetical protein [Deltaproteobacteria bacterium]